MILPYQEDFDAIQLWLDLPKESRPTLPPKREELWKRWNMADDLLRELIVEKKVINRLVEKFGYSVRTAQRDIQMAKASYPATSPAEKEYIKKMLIDYNTDMMIKAGKAGRYDSVAKLAKVIMECAGINKKDELPEDPEANRRPVALQPVYEPKLVGGSFMSDTERKELVNRMLKDKRDKGFIEQSTLTELTGLDDDGSGGTSA